MNGNLYTLGRRTHDQNNSDKILKTNFLKVKITEERLKNSVRPQTLERQPTGNPNENKLEKTLCKFNNLKAIFIKPQPKFNTDLIRHKINDFSKKEISKTNIGQNDKLNRIQDIFHKNKPTKLQTGNFNKDIFPRNFGPKSRPVRSIPQTSMSEISSKHNSKHSFIIIRQNQSSSRGRIFPAPNHSIIKKNFFKGLQLHHKIRSKKRTVAPSSIKNISIEQDDPRTQNKSLFSANPSLHPSTNSSRKFRKEGDEWVEDFGNLYVCGTKDITLPERTLLGAGKDLVLDKRLFIHSNRTIKSGVLDHVRCPDQKMGTFMVVNKLDRASVRLSN